MKMASAIHTMAFWVMTPCSLAGGHQHLKDRAASILSASLYTDMEIGKGKDFSVHAMKTCKGSTGIPPIINCDVFRPLYPRERTQVPIG